MNENLKMFWLRILLRVLSVGFLAAFIPWITLIILNIPVLSPGSQFAPLLRFQPYNANYESMMAAIHIVWAVMLWRASENPAKDPLFIDFTIWANAAHGFVMLIATPLQKGLGMMVIEARASATTLTVAVFEIAPLVAVTMMPLITEVGAVKIPRASIVPLLTLQVGVIATKLLN